MPLLLLSVTVVGGVSASIVTHDATFFAYVAEVLWLVTTHLQASGYLNGELILSTLIRVILIRLAFLQIFLLSLYISIIFLI